MLREERKKEKRANVLFRVLFSRLFSANKAAAATREAVINFASDRKGREKTWCSLPLVGSFYNQEGDGGKNNTDLSLCSNFFLLSLFNAIFFSSRGVSSITSRTSVTKWPMESEEEFKEGAVLYISIIFLSCFFCQTFHQWRFGVFI